MHWVNKMNNNIEDFLKRNADCSLSISFDPYFKTWEACLIDNEEEYDEFPMVFASDSNMNDAISKLNDRLSATTHFFKQ